MTDKKYCEDCRHCVPVATRPERKDQFYFAKCSAAPGFEPDGALVARALDTGRALSYCSTVRMLGMQCGPDAKLFEAK